MNRARKQLPKKFYAQKIDHLKTDHPKEWWRDIKQITGTNSDRHDIYGMANTLCDGNKDILAEIINNAFSAVSDDMEPITAADSFTISQIIDPVHDRYIITVPQVEKSLMKINISKARGPDCMPNWLLHDLASDLAPPICAI